MADPDKSKTMSMISFYSFPPSGIDDPEEFALSLRKKWKVGRSLMEKILLRFQSVSLIQHYSEPNLIFALPNSLSKLWDECMLQKKVSTRR
jgi:hypothetical protein